MLGENAPQDWGIADKTEWVSDSPLNGEARLPALEGYDVVGFSESVNFAAGQMKQQPAHDNRKQPAMVRRCDPGFHAQGNKCVQGGAPKPATSPAQRMEQARKAGKWGGKTVGERRTTPPKPRPEPEPKPEPKPKPKPEPRQVPVAENSNANQYDIDESSSESISRIKELGSLPATDKRFQFGQIAFKQVDKHYSGQSRFEEELSKLSGKGGFGNKIMSALIRNFDLDQKIEIKKNTFVTPREILQKSGLDTNSPERVKKFQGLLQTLNSHLDPSGSWKTSPVHSLSEGLGFFEAEHIQHREDMSNSDTSPSDIRVKAFSIGNDFKDSNQWADLSPEEIDLAFHLLPTSAQTSLKKSGSPDKYYDPLSPDGQSKNPSDLRGRLALFMWTKQGGRDGYSLSGSRRSPGEFQVEHIQDLSSGGKDTASNFVMLLKRVNEPRSSLPLPTFVEQASRRAKEIHKNLADPSGEFLKIRLKALQQRGIHDSLADSSSPLNGTLDSISNTNFFETISKNSESLPENLRPSQEDFAIFSDRVRSITDPNTKISDLTTIQLDQFLSAIEDFGADSIKVKEYIGRSMFNNYHDGNRIQSIKTDGTIVSGRGGTNSTPAPLQALQNRLIGKPEGIDPTDYKTGITLVNRAHDAIRNARNALIEQGGGDFSSFHEVLGESLTKICGLSDGSPEWVRNRKINTRDLTRTIENYLGIFPPNRPVSGDLGKLYISAALDYYGISKEQFDNPEMIKKKAEKDKALKIRSTMEKITGQTNGR